MKLVLSFLIFFSFLGSSFAWMGVVQNNILPLPIVIDYATGLTAKLDSQEVRMNELYDVLDSMNRVQIKQTSSIKRLNRRDVQNKARLKKEKRLHEEDAQKSSWIISLLGVGSAIGVFLALGLFLMNRSRNKAKNN